VDEATEPAESPSSARRGGLRPALWIAVAVVVVAAAVLGIAAARNGSNDASDGPGTVATDSRVLVTFDDDGLHASPPTVSAGIIEVAFADRRSKPTGEDVQLYYEQQPKVGGDLIAGPGGHPRVLLCAHRYSLVVRVDGAVKARIPFDVTGTSADCKPSSS